MLQSSGGGGGGDTEQLQKELKDAQNKLRQCNLENRALKQEIEKIRNR
jgi:cell division protein FtsB